MRLDRAVSQATGLSRSQAQRVIRDGEVSVNGEVLSDPSLHIDAQAQIQWRGDAVEHVVGPRYFMLHKPLEYVCAARDSRHRTVMQLLDVASPASLHIAGRLDVDATGLVLITDDGDWSHRVTSPRHQIPKVYRAQLAEPLGEHDAAILAQGVQLKEEPEPCRPAIVERLAEREVRITVTEGKYHQVKRMFAAVGNSVLALHRERIGSIELDPDLAPGEFRLLTQSEVEGF
jgi:16S rRNA pseudouridine516 synthase